MKRSRAALLLTALTATLLCSMTAFAGWRYDERGYWWDNGDGSYPANQWMWLDGNEDGISECYYFDGSGYMLSDTTTPDGYTVDKNGAWILDGIIQTKTDPSFGNGTDNTATSSNAADPSVSVGSSASGMETGPSADSVYMVGSLNVRPLGEFAGASVLNESSSITLTDPQMKKMAVLLYVDMTKDTDYQSVMQSAQALGVDLNSEAMKNMITDVFVSSFTSSMGSQPVSAEDHFYPTGSWRHLRYDPSSMEGTYTDILVKYDSNAFYAIVFGGSDGYVDVDRFMTECLY